MISSCFVNVGAMCTKEVTQNLAGCSEISVLRCPYKQLCNNMLKDGYNGSVTNDSKQTLSFQSEMQNIEILCTEEFLLHNILVLSFYLNHYTKSASFMLILQQFVKCTSATIPSFIFQISSTAAPSNGFVLKKFFQTEFSWVHASVIMSTLVLLFLFILVCFLYRSRRAKCTTIYVEITSGGDCVIVPVLTLSLCPSYFHFTTPSINEVSLSTFPNLQIFVLYSSFKVTNKLTSKTVYVPNYVNIGLFTYYKLKKILKQPFNAYVFVTHQGVASVLNPSIDAQF